MYGRRSSLGAFFALTWMLGVLWAFATPLMQGPDEVSHVRKAAAVVRGQFLSDDGHVQVPESIALIDRPCWLYRQRCEGVPSGSADETVEAGSYHTKSHPTYYMAVGVPTLVAPGTWSVYGMRVISALWVSALLTLAARAAVSHPQPRWVMVGLATGVTPMALFLAGAVNPSGVEIAAGLALWLTMLAWLAFPERVAGAGVAAFVSALALVGLRPLSALWVASIVGAVILLSRESVRAVVHRRVVIGASVIAAAGLAAVIWTGESGTLDELIGPESPRYNNPSAIFWDSLMNLSSYLHQMVGSFGWTDNPLPFHVFLAWFSVIALVVIPAWALSKWRARLVLGGLLVATAVLPIVLQFRSAPEKGLIWQGRYLLPLAAGIPVVAGVLLARIPEWERVAGRALAVAVLGILGTAHVAAFWWALHANVAGRSAPWFDFDARWQPPGGWIVTTLAYGIVVALWLMLVHRMGDRPGLPGRGTV